MSGSTNAAVNASASVPRPKSQTIYCTRTSPMMRDKNVETISTMVAENALCVCDGRSSPNARAQREGAGGLDGVGGEPATGVDSSGVGQHRALKTAPETPVWQEV